MAAREETRVTRGEQPSCDSSLLWGCTRETNSRDSSLLSAIRYSSSDFATCRDRASRFPVGHSRVSDVSISRSPKSHLHSSSTFDSDLLEHLPRASTRTCFLAASRSLE